MVRVLIPAASARKPWVSTFIPKLRIACGCDLWVSRVSSPHSHGLSTAAADAGMSTALRSVELLDVLSSTPAGPSVARLVSMLRFHIPLIEPDVRISRIRLSDKDSYLRPRKITSAQFEPDKTQRLIEILVRI